MPTETFVSCAKAGWAGAKKTSAANKTALTIRHDLCSALRSSILGAFKLIQLRFSSALGASRPSEFHPAEFHPAEFHLAQVFLGCCRNATVANERCGSLRTSLTVRSTFVRWISWGDHGMNQRLHPLSCLLTLAVLALCSTDAVARASHKPQHAKKPHEVTGARHNRHAALKKAEHAKKVVALPSKSTPSGDVASPSDDASPLSGDLAAVRNAIDLVRKAKTGDATAIEKTIGDPAARKLV